jgi:hypothetical protein
MFAIVLGVIGFTWQGGTDRGLAQTAPGLGTPEATCNGDGTATVTFHWGSDSGARELWLDVSLFANDFQVGTFLSAGPFPTNTLGFTWEGIRADIPHFFRVRASGFQGEQTQSFTSWFTPCATRAVLFEPKKVACFDAGRIPPQFGLGQGLRVNVSFEWAPIGSSAQAQWLDLSIFDNDFAEGTFLSFGPLHPLARVQFWQNLLPGVIHYYRLNTLTPDGWMPTGTKSFIFTC